MAQHRLPFSFNVVPKLPPVQRRVSFRAYAPLLLEPSAIPLLAEKHLSNETPSGTRPQEGDPRAIVPFLTHSEAVTSSDDSSLTNGGALVVERDTRAGNSLVISSLSTLPNVNERLDLNRDPGDARYALCATSV